MKWFDQWFAKKCNQAWNAATQKEYNVTSTKMEILQLGGSAKRSFDAQASMNFRLHHAENGWIVEVNSYDQRTDRHSTKLHLIGDDEEFDKSICQIITLEALRS